MQLKVFVAVKSCEEIFKGHNRTIETPPFHLLGFNILHFSDINGVEIQEMSCFIANLF